MVAVKLLKVMQVVSTRKNVYWLSSFESTDYISKEFIQFSEMWIFLASFSAVILLTFIRFVYLLTFSILM